MCYYALIINMEEFWRFIEVGEGKALIVYGLNDC